MSFARNASTEAAVQYLTWALEQIEEAGNQEAARHARLALEALREGTRRPIDAGLGSSLFR